MTEPQRMLALDLPLQGRQLIEASAGTGKTWTLAALYVRLVLGHGRGGLACGLLPPQVLVMTFTEAATAELRERVRTRLVEAARAFFSADPDIQDPFLTGLMHDTPAEQWPACAQRLTQAVSWMDESAIHTIHGWCMRALREHAFASRSLFDLQHLPDAEQLWLELARDHVRQFVYPLTVTDLQALEAEKLTPDPQTWISALADLRRAHQKQPHARIDPATLPTPTEVLAQTRQWWAQDNALLEEVRQHFDPDLAQRIIDFKRQHKGVLGHLRADLIEAALQRVLAWVSGHALGVPADLPKLGHAMMVDKQWPPDPPHPALLAIDRWVEWQTHKPPPARDAVLQHALHSMLQAYDRRKAQAGLFDFQDLLERLYWALQTSPNLADTLRTQYPVALVDEFQDTDPWQYGSLDRIYPPEAQGTLVMIGDPKQAIYSFRGADIDTYVRARQQCVTLNRDSLHSLRQNRRSTPALLATLNALFSTRTDLFGPQIQFEPAEPASSPEGAAAMPEHPVQVVVSEGEIARNAEQHRQFLLSHAMADMVQKLQSGQAQPRDLAVLVRSHSQADAVLKALTASGIAAVYLSDRSQVYQSDDARDLWLLLRALAQPRHSGALRAALGTPLWGLTETQLLTLTTSDDAWDTLLDQALQWHRHWLTHGIFPMLRQWLLDTGAATRLLERPDGERRLTNVLHLAELLQQATHPLTAQGIAALPHATVRYLGREIRRQGPEDGPAQTRLESDEQRVRVVSFHKSKGLQYPHVYIPFLSSGAAAPERHAEDEDGDADRSRDVLEDTRLLYVALTRAEQSLWLGVYPHKLEIQKSGDASALCRWLGREQASSTWSSVWFALAQRIPGLQVSQPTDTAQVNWRAPAPAPMAGGPLDTPTFHHPLWWSASFSALTRQLGDKTEQVWNSQGNRVAREIDTEDLRRHPEASQRPTYPSPWQEFGAGARYGTILHDLLEWQANHHWPLAQGQIGDDWRALLERQPGLKDTERALITPWLAQVLQRPLPMGDAPDLVLGQLRQPQYWAEMPFHFSTAPVAVTEIDAMICNDLFKGQARPALRPHMLGGMVNGFIDLVFEHGGRYWVLDYKSNLLDHYDSDTLQTALLDKRYDVQSVIYLLALHRLLQHRIANYQPEHHLGGAAYLFMRGIDTPGAGVVMQSPSVRLILDLDALLGHPARNAA